MESPDGTTLGKDLPSSATSQTATSRHHLVFSWAWGRGMNDTNAAPAPTTRKTVLQAHLDAADHDWFARNEGARHRIRLHVPGETVEAGRVDGYVVVTMGAAGELRRRFLGEAVAA